MGYLRISRFLIFHPNFMQMQRSDRIYFYLRMLLLAVYIINGLFIIPRLSITYDEGDHLDYAIRVVKGHPEKIKPYDDASTMPVSVLNTIPRIVEQITHPGLVKTDWGKTDISHGRYITLFVCLLTGIFIYCWAKELYGEKAGMLSLFLFVFCPNLNAHSTLVTTDAYAALFTVSTLYYFWKFLRTGLWKYVLLLGISLGAAQLAKQSLTHLFVIILVFSFFILIKRGTLFRNFRKNLVRTMVVALAVLLVINIGFLFNHTGKSLGVYPFTSQFFNRVQSSFSFLNAVPLPLPAPYIQGLDLTKKMDEMGPGNEEVSGNTYILGQSRKGTGFWYYYFIVLLFKTPLSVLAGFLFLILWFISKPREKLFWENEFLLLFAMGYFLIFFSFFVNTQSGMRHLLILFPLLYILMGKLAGMNGNSKYFQFIVIPALLYSVITFYVYFPNLISYTNELLWDKKKAYTIMGDSNIDYGQGNYWLEKYLQANPEVKMASSKPEAGKLIIGVNDFLDLYERHNYDWLNQNFKPVDHLRHCFLIFDVPETALKQKGLIQ
jgi:Dolichyl-phosphate-mannose-protein mannosyltransferase